jgi:Predicted membrane protein
LDSNIILIAILAISVLGKANSVAIASCVLLFINLLKLDKYVFPIVENYGVFIGLVILITAILIPIANGQITFESIKVIFTSWTGIAALLISLFTTYLSGLGLQYLTVQGNGQVMPALILGAVIAAAFLDGVPVGPLITSGILALGIKLFHK